MGHLEAGGVFIGRTVDQNHRLTPHSPAQNTPSFENTFLFICVFASWHFPQSSGGRAELSVTASDLFLFDSSPISTCTLRHWAFSCSAPQSLDLWAIFSGCKRRNLDHQHCFLLMSAIGLGIFKLQTKTVFYILQCV